MKTHLAPVAHAEVRQRFFVVVEGRQQRAGLRAMAQNLRRALQRCGVWGVRFGSDAAEGYAGDDTSRNEVYRQRFEVGFVGDGVEML